MAGQITVAALAAAGAAGMFAVVGTRLGCWDCAGTTKRPAQKRPTDPKRRRRHTKKATSATATAKAKAKAKSNAKANAKATLPSSARVRSKRTSRGPRPRCVAVPSGRSDRSKRGIHTPSGADLSPTTPVTTEAKHCTTLTTQAAAAGELDGSPALAPRNDELQQQLSPAAATGPTRSDLDTDRVLREVAMALEALTAGCVAEGLAAATAQIEGDRTRRRGGGGGDGVASTVCEEGDDRRC